MALFLTEADVTQLVDMRVAVEVVEEAFRQMAAGEVTNVPRARSQAPGFVLHSMSASAAYLGLAGWKNYTTTRAGAKFHVGLYEQSTGQLVAVIEANRLGQLRTGAVTGVAVSFMAPAEMTELGLFGAGYQAETQLTAIATVRSLKQVFVYSRDEAKREAFAERMSASLNVDVTPVDRPQEAVEDLPLVVTATSARQPVFDGNWLSEGTLVCAVGSNWLNKAEIDATTVRRADIIVCDSVEACRIEAGDFVDALEKGIFDWSRAINLADVVAGRATGRSRKKAITIFKSVGLAMEDVALGGRILQIARAKGMGVELPL